MLKIALTGGIATGKSYVLDQFRRRGVPTLDADELAHGVTAGGTEATSAIAARFGVATDTVLRIANGQPHGFCNLARVHGSGGSARRVAAGMVRRPVAPE